MHLGQSLRNDLQQPHVIDPFIGVFDCLSASVAARRSSNLLYSAFGFAASYYGLPDSGYASWSDLVQSVGRVRQIQPAHRMLVDLDDGYSNNRIVCRVTRELETMGVAMVLLQDQGRPAHRRRSDTDQLLPLEAYLSRLDAVLAQRHSMCVMAKINAAGEELARRINALNKTDVDVVLVGDAASFEDVLTIRALTDKPIAVDHSAVGNLPPLSIGELGLAGVTVHLYSNPLLLASKEAMQAALKSILDSDGRWPEAVSEAQTSTKHCLTMLESNEGSDPVRLAEALNAADAALRVAFAQPANR